MILSEIIQGWGCLTLNRPEALNALSLEMVRSLTDILGEWSQDPAVKGVLIDGEGKAFCAGGDIKSVYWALKEGDIEAAESFFREEYALNLLIETYPKPYVSIIDGIAMGGGLGISIHGTQRWVSTRSTLAMPESNIGFFTDAGMSRWLQGPLGAYIGLTGAFLDSADAFHCGWATDLFDPGKKASLKEAILKDDDLNPYRLPPSHPSTLGASFIQECFSHETLDDILQSLEKERVYKVLDILKKKSLYSLRAILTHLQHPQDIPPAERYKKDFQLSQAFLRGHDFTEGVRALLIDKDNSPCWYMGII